MIDWFIGILNNKATGQSPKAYKMGEELAFGVLADKCTCDFSFSSNYYNKHNCVLFFYAFKNSKWIGADLNMNGRLITQTAVHLNNISFKK